MGFFQNLKDDLSLEVNDIIVNELGDGETDKSDTEMETDTELDITLESDVPPTDEVDDGDTVTDEDSNFDTQSLLDLLKSDEFKEITLNDEAMLDDGLGDTPIEELTEELTEKLTEEAITGEALTEEIIAEKTVIEGTISEGTISEGTVSEEPIEDITSQEIGLEGSGSPVRDALNSLRNASLRYEQQQIQAMLQDQIEDKIISETEKQLVAEENESISDIDGMFLFVDGDATSDSDTEETDTEETNIEETNIEETDTKTENTVVENITIENVATEELEALNKFGDVPGEEIDLSAVEVKADDIKVFETEDINTAIVDMDATETEAKPEEVAKEVSEETDSMEITNDVEERAYAPVIDEPYQGLSDEVAIIAAGMVINGDIASDGNIELTGTVNGNINILGKLSVAGKVNGNIKANDMFVDGAELVGDIKVDDSVKVGNGSVIIGNIEASTAVIAGAVKGDIDVHGPVILDSSAIIMGNIKSMAVQINNGAVIEGMCSQCYADVNPTDFFNEFKKSTE